MMKQLHPRLINFKTSLYLRRSANCLISEFEARASTGGGNPVSPATGTSFAITERRIYVPEITLSKKCSVLQLKTGLKKIN